MVAKWLHFVISYMKLNKKQKQTVESAQYGLEISFKSFNSCVKFIFTDTPHRNNLHNRGLAKSCPRHNNLVGKNTSNLLMIYSPFFVRFKFLNPAETHCKSEELLNAITLRKPVIFKNPAFPNIWCPSFRGKNFPC